MRAISGPAHVAAMQPADAGEPYDLATVRWFEAVRCGRVADQTHVQPVLVAIARVKTHETQQGAGEVFPTPPVEALGNRAGSVIT
jgi:hypothetical protein